MKNVFIFLIGMVAGSAITGVILKKEYEKRVYNETEELRDFYRNRQGGPDQTEDSTEVESESKSEPEPEDSEEPDNDYEAALKHYIKDGEKTMKQPCIISPDEYGELDDYKLRSLVYYADEILADDAGCPVDNIAELIGENALNHFGDYEEDSVFVRNYELQCDFEILLDLRTYAEAMKVPPYHKEA